MNKELKPTFKLSQSELNLCLDDWIDNGDEYRTQNYRFGQHLCNWFKLERLSGENKQIEEILWQMELATSVTFFLQNYDIINYDN